MIQIRKAEERGHFDHGWLDTHHTFSFGDYHDERNMGFRALRVINEDRVAAGQGFGTHGHRDMEILTYVLEGQLAHHDSMGNGSAIAPGDVQFMSAGTGVRHSEFNASKSEPVHFYQIWILPNVDGATPRYSEKRFDETAKAGKLLLVASGSGADGAIALRQDVNVYASVVKPAESLALALPAGRHLWVQVLRGGLDVNGKTLSAGDGLSASKETEFRFSGGDQGAEFLAFDLA
jgi:redox-sensitive bicupin YhaK (pirin superfamily)